MESSLTLKQSILKEFKFNYEDCSISENHIVELLGYDADNVPEPVLETIEFLLNRTSRKS